MEEYRELATHWVMHADRLRECADFKVGVKISRANVAAAGPCTLSHWSEQWIDADGG